MSNWPKYLLDWRRLRQARKAIPDITWRLPLGYCQNLGEFVLSEGRNYKLFFILLEANPILPMTRRDGSALAIPVLSLALPGLSLLVPSQFQQYIICDNKLNTLGTMI